MATIHVSVPDELQDWVQAQTEAGRYRNAGDYIRDLIVQDQHRNGGLIELQALIAEGFDSGLSDRSLDEVLAMARARVRAAPGP